MNVRDSFVRTRLAALSTAAVLTVPSILHAQNQFVSGPLTWSPVFQLRDTGIDSNVFNTTTDPREDLTSVASSQVDSTLKLGVLQAMTQGGVDYLYFERYKSERGLNGHVGSRINLPLTRVSPEIAVSWAHTRERSNNEIDIRAPRTDWGYAMGLSTKVTPRLSLTATGGKQRSEYEQGFVFRGVELAPQLTRESLVGTASGRITLTPFTSLSLDAAFARDEFPSRPEGATDNVRGNLTFEFSPDAVIHGHASVGYHSMKPRRGDDSSTAAAFDGVTSSTELGYTFLGVTRFSGRFTRDSAYSVSLAQPYYVSTAGGLDILQNLVGPLDLALRVSREQLKYPETPAAVARVDNADSIGGGLSLRVGDGAVVALLYDNSRRRSTGGALFNYDRRRLYTTITYGL
jgi:hypothetical protein